MRILVLTNMYPPHHYGGYELSCRDVMARLAARGHEVRVLTTAMRVDGVADDPREAGRGVHRELRFYWDDHVLLQPPLRERARIERHNQAALARHLDDHRPDVVSAWNMGAMSLGLLTTVIERSTPLLLSVCDDWLVYGPKLDAWSRPLVDAPVRRALAQRWFGVPAAPRRLAPDVTVCFVSDFVRRRALEQSRWTIDRSTVVYSGIDSRDFPPAEAVERPWRGRLLYVGRLDERKGVYTAVEALRRLPDHTLRIVGSGDRVVLDRLRALQSEPSLAGRLELAVLPREEVAAAYRDADAFLFTSEWDEPFGLTPVEAMASATPVVATATGGSGEFLVDGVNCVRYPPGDVGALVAAVAALRADPSRRARLVAGGLATAGELTVDALADVLESWHAAAAARFAGGAPPDRALALPSVALDGGKA